MLILIIALAAGLVALIQTRSQPLVAVPSPATLLPTATPTPAIPSAEVMVVNLEAGSFYFTPDIITVKKGQPVMIVMKSADMMHDFVIDELNVKMPVVQSGNIGEVEFIPSEVGEFEYYCSVSDHRAKGQVGKLIVTE